MPKNEIKIENIRKDLKDIRYYYSYRNDILNAVEFCGESKFTDKVKLYNRIISHAPINLYHLYYNLYISGYTQEALSNKLCYSLEYVSRLNSKLLLFFMEELNSK